MQSLVTLPIQLSCVDLETCIGCMWQDFGSGETAGAASVGRGQGLLYTPHKWFQTAPQQTHHRSKLSPSAKIVALL